MYQDSNPLDLKYRLSQINRLNHSGDKSRHRCLTFLALALYFSILGWGVLITSEEGYASPVDAPTVAQKKMPRGPRDVDPNDLPLPKKRDFWKMVLFWGGGILCMYLVGRKVFKEQSHEHRTLKLFRDEIGAFFPEFLPINLTKWVTIAGEHLYSSWRSADFEGMKSFTTEDFQSKERAAVKERAESGRRRVSHLGGVLKVHPLGAELTRDSARPPQGVKLTLRVELKVIDFLEDIETGETLGKKKQLQQQWIWTLLHTGKTWSLDDVRLATGDITDLAERTPLPPIGQWRRPTDEASTDQGSST